MRKLGSASLDSRSHRKREWAHIRKSSFNDCDEYGKDRDKRAASILPITAVRSKLSSL